MPQEVHSNKNLIGVRGQRNETRLSFPRERNDSVSYFSAPQGPVQGAADQWTNSAFELRVGGIVAVQQTPITMWSLIAVCDREADYFELFERQRQEPRVELLVRAKHERVLQPQEHERVLEPQEKLLAELSKGPPVGHVEVERISERRKSSKKKARPKRSKRTALCELRFRRLSIPAIQGRAEPVTLWGVRIVELHPPEEEEAVSWTLLTSLEVGDVAGDVLRVLLGCENETAAGTTRETSWVYDRLEGGCAAGPPPILPVSLLLCRGAGRVGDSEPHGSKSTRRWAVRRGARYGETVETETDRGIYSSYDV